MNQLNDFNMFETVHNCGLYRATIRKIIFPNHSYEVSVDYVDMEGNRHREFCKCFRTEKKALDKLANYFKGETVEWTRL